MSPGTQSIITTEHWLTISGARTRYLHAGSGPPLILLHGLLGYSFSWRYVIPTLCTQAEIYAPDMPGVGLSDRPANLDCSLHACAMRLLEFMDQAGIRACDIVASSHGGAVGMLAATMAPNRFRSLVLVSPVNPWSTYRKHWIAFLKSPLVTPMLPGMALHVQLFHAFYLRRLFGDPRRIRPGTLEGYSVALRRPGSFEYGLRVLRAWRQDMRELESLLPKIADIPALLIWGDRDAAVDPRSAQPLRKQFRDCRLLMFQGVGHLPYEEVPEEFNRVVSEFLRHRGET